MSTVERVLVTGGCGFIGANLVRRIREGRHWQVRVVDDLRTGRESYVPADLAEVVIGDVADPAVLEPALDGVDAVVHLASQTGVLPSVEDPARDFEGSAMTTFRVLEALPPARHRPLRIRLVGRVGRRRDPADPREHRAAAAVAVRRGQARRRGLRAGLSPGRSA